MLKRIIRAYGAAQDDESSNVESVAKLAGVPRPSISSNNNFLRSIGVLEMDKPKLTALGVRIATGMGVENQSIVSEALQEVVKTTPAFSQLFSVVRARGSMDMSSFKGQIILAAGLKANSPGLTTIKSLTDLLEESGMFEFRDDKVFLAGQVRANDNSGASAVIREQETSSQPPIFSPQPAGISNAPIVELLLAKFPELDPTWPDEVKLKWFDAFDRLMKGRGL